MREIGQKGGQARAQSLSVSERKRIATKASKAAAKVRTAKAKGQETKVKGVSGSARLRAR